MSKKPISGHEDGTLDALAKLRKAMDEVAETVNDPNVRNRVLALLPVQAQLRHLGTQMLSASEASSAKQRILKYLRQNVGIVIDSDELALVAGITEFARRIRELRVQDGWPIISGVSPHVPDELDFDIADDVDISGMSPRQYMLLADAQDSEAANRWAKANAIRRGGGSTKARLLEYFRAYVGQPIPRDELRYIADGSSEWARRTRELRTEDAWPIVTKTSGDPSLPKGMYMLARDQQGKVHDRQIPELVRRQVMARDLGRCRWRGCSWPNGYPETDHRFLEVHHIVEHSRGGGADPDNLVTLCNLHHDEVHRTGELDLDPAPRAANE